MKLKFVLTGLALSGVTVLLLAHEEPFGYLRGAQSEAKGEWELTQWTTARVGKESGRYLGVDLATELEYGVNDRFQVSLYLLTDYHFTKDATGGSEVFDDRNRFGVSGASGEFKYQLRDPFKESFGFSLYFEPGYNSIERAGGERHDEFELETKLIVQKNFLDNRLVAVLNYTLEPEFERSAGGGWETNLDMEWTAGVSWRFAEHWWLGVESRLDTEFADADLNRSQFVTFFAGPTLHYSGDRLFATLTALPQVAGWPDRQGTGGLHLDDRERLEIRLKLGTEF